MTNENHDERHRTLRCTSCGTLNRVPVKRLSLNPICGKCKTLVDFPFQPVNVTAASFDRERSSWLEKQLAREVSTRLGAKGVVAGEVAPLAGGYVLSVRLVDAADGSTLLAGRETADDASGIIAAVEKLSRKLREGIGESLRSIRAEPALAQVTTGSLAALKAYTDGSRAADDARDAEAVRLLQQAVALDSNFAMAWRKLSVAILHLGNDREGEVAAIGRAYALRARLSPREANHIEASTTTTC